MLEEKKKIIFLVRFIPIILVVVVAVSLIFVSIAGIHNYFSGAIKQEQQKIKQQEISRVKKHLNATYQLIDNIYMMTSDALKRELRTSVDVGFNLLVFIHNKFKNKNKYFIISKIKQHLEDIRFYNDKSGYFFMFDTNGKLLMWPMMSVLEGENFYNYQDIKGKYLVKDFLAKLKKHPEGVYDDGWFIDPVTKKVANNLIYVKYYKPLNIIIGSEIYENIIIQESENNIKKVFNKVNKALHRKDFVLMTKDGKVLYSSDNDVKKEAKKIVASAKYQITQTRIDNKIMFTKYYKPLNLVIYQELDLNELRKMVDNKRDDIKQVVSAVITQFLTAALIFIIIVLIISLYITKMIEKMFEKYDHSINEEKEKAQNAAKVKSEFLANMSHEIRTPLNAMFGFIKILHEKEMDEESKKYLNIIEKSGENLLVIINDILDFSKIESGKFPIEKIEFNPKEEIEVLKDLFESKASEKNINLKIIEENLKYNIITDSTRVKQVIANLLSNAIKFTHPGKNIELIVKYNEEKERLCVEVVDEGIGIPKEKLDTIFEAFSQADNSTTRRYGGTGLGLTISYKLIGLLGGELKVESEVGKGSRFYFEIPAKKAGELKEINTKKVSLEDKFNYHLLVVEDNAANQMFMKVILKKMGVTFDIANNGAEGVEKFKKGKYDFILMDENMPNMNGIEATKKIREYEREHNLHHTIIIALTANALEGDKERFILAGMDYYLSKPLDIEKLKEIFSKESK